MITRSGIGAKVGAPASAVGHATTSNYDGEFLVSGLEQGTYQLMAYKSGYDIDFSKVALGTQSTEVTVTMRPHKGISVKVLDAESKAPLRFVFVGTQISSKGRRFSISLNDRGEGFIPRLFGLVAIFAMLSVACASNNSMSDIGATSQSKDVIGCPVTIPTNRPNDDPRHEGNFANDALATLLWREGIVTFAPGKAGLVHADGSLQMKFWWWRLKPGRLRIEGERLDATAPPLRSEVMDGYTDIGFQATFLVFPTPGCWRVTGHLGEDELVFVTSVVNLTDQD